MADAGSDVVSLVIGGQLYQGWTSVEIVRSLDAMSGSFSLALADRASAVSLPIEIQVGAACEVRVGGDVLINGWVDAIEVTIDREQHTIEVTGRDRAADLIDCSAINTPGSWRNVSIEAIASDLAKPFGISVTARASTAPNLKRFAIQQGEDVHAALERLCRYRGLIALSTVDGNIELVSPKPSAAVGRIAYGEKLLSGTARHDGRERFSDYLVKGQASGDDQANGKAVAQPKGAATDPGIKRHRPLLVIGEEQSDGASLEKRAKWEATVRAGRAQEITAVVNGWRSAGGALWDRGQCAEIMAEPLFVDAALMIVEVTFRYDGSGRKTELRCSPPEAWTQLAVPDDADASRIGKAA